MEDQTSHALIHATRDDACTSWPTFLTCWKTCGVTWFVGRKFSWTMPLFETTTYQQPRLMWLVKPSLWVPSLLKISIFNRKNKFNNSLWGIPLVVLGRRPNSAAEHANLARSSTSEFTSWRRPLFRERPTLALPDERPGSTAVADGRSWLQSHLLLCFPKARCPFVEQQQQINMQ